MKIKCFLPIIVAVSVLACVLVPFAVSADTQTYDFNGYELPYPPIELDELGFTDHMFIHVGSSTHLICTDGQIGFKDKDGFWTDYCKCRVYLFDDNLSAWTLQSEFDYSKYEWCYSGNTLQISDFNRDQIVWSWHNIGRFSQTGTHFIPDDVRVYGDSNFVFPPPPAPPAPPPSFTDHIANVDTSLAFVEVLGVLPACLACVVAYESIRRGIGYVCAIISNA